MNQRDQDEAAIREAAAICVNALKGLNGTHLHYAQQIIESELGLFYQLENEESNRRYSAG